MKIKTLILTLIFSLQILTTIAQVNNETKSKMFCKALEYISTAPNYVVVTIKNLKTGETREICTESTLIQGAMMYETGNWFVDCKKYKARYFEFSNDSALLNLSFDLYSKAELDKFAKTINITDIVQQVKNGNLTSKTFSGSRKEQVMFAHLMFNNGVMMTRGCWAGNICGLTFFKKG